MQLRNLTQIADPNMYISLFIKGCKRINNGLASRYNFKENRWDIETKLNKDKVFKVRDFNHVEHFRIFRKCKLKRPGAEETQAYWSVINPKNVEGLKNTGITAGIISVNIDLDK